VINMDILLARGRSRTMFRFAIVMTTCHLIAFAVGLHWGVVGVAVGYALSTTFVEPAQTVLAARCLGVSPMVFVRAILGVAGAALGMCAVVLTLRLALVDAGVAPLARLAACVATGGVTYAALLLWRVPEIAQEVRGVLRRRAPAGGIVATPAAVES
jgi:hypothetical protein